MNADSAPAPAADDEATAGTLLTGRVGLIAIVMGLLAGAVAGLTFAAMKAVSRLVWESTDLADDRWYIAAAIMVAGLIIAALRPLADDISLAKQLADADDLTHLRRRAVAVLGLLAIVAVGFGGAIGPEAGLIAVVMELSAIVASRIARTSAEARLIGRTGIAGALAGLYVSPPGAAAYDDDSLAPTKLAVLVASVSGLVGFFVVMSLLRIPHHPLSLPGHVTDRWGLDLVLALVPAGLATAWVALVPGLHHAFDRLLATVGGVRAQTLVGTAIFAALAATWPALRFSGHDEFGQVAAWVADGSWLLLGAMAVLKPLAMIVCLSAGWRGGEFFPLMLTGACLGALTTVVLPISLAAAMVAGMAAATAMGLRKPVAAVLIVAFLSGGTALGPMLVGGLFPALLLRRRAQESSSLPDAAKPPRS